jgi:hypothetical protein
MDFASFYQDGGVFMHVVTLLTAFVAIGMVRRVGTMRRAFRSPTEQLGPLRQAGAAVPSLVAAIVMAGTLGTALGWIEVHAALLTVPRDQWMLAGSLGLRISTYPLVWSLLCAIPLMLGHGAMRHFEQRLRGLIEKHA